MNATIPPWEACRMLLVAVSGLYILLGVAAKLLGKVALADNLLASALGLLFASWAISWGAP